VKSSINRYALNKKFLNPSRIPLSKLSKTDEIMKFTHVCTGHLLRGDRFRPETFQWLQYGLATFSIRSYRLRALRRCGGCRLLFLYHFDCASFFWISRSSSSYFRFSLLSLFISSSKVAALIYCLNCSSLALCFCNSRNASISGFPLGSTPGDPGGFVK